MGLGVANPRWLGIVISKIDALVGSFGNFLYGDVAIPDTWG